MFEDPGGWLRALVATASALAVLAGIAFAELSNRWARRALASLAVVATAASIAGVFVIVSSVS